MVPSLRMLWLAAPALAVLAILPVFGTPLLAVSLVGMLALAVFAAADAAASVRRLDGLHAALPEITRLTRRRPGSTILTLAPAPHTPRRLRLGLDLPDGLETEEGIRAVALQDRAAPLRIEWPLRAHERGEFSLSALYVEARSWLGLWDLRARVPLAGVVRVYPDLIEDRNRLAGIFLNRDGLGIRRQRVLGKGREFERLREYLPGDSYEDIHWKATARRGRPVTKLYQIERTQEVYVAIDASRLSARVVNEAGDTQLERYVVAALLLGMVADRQGDHFGVLSFSNRIHSFIRARRGKEHFAVCRDAIYRAQPERVNPDYEEFAASLRTRLNKRALIVVLADLDDPVLAESFARAMELVTRQHLVVVVSLNPPGAKQLFSEADIAACDDLYTQLRGHLHWWDLRETQRALHYRGVSMYLTRSENLTTEAVTQYLRVKQRQLL